MTHRATKAETEQRLDRIEEVLRRRSIGPSTARTLAAEFGCSERNVWRLRSKVLDRVKNRLKADGPDRGAAGVLMRAQGIGDEAIKAGQLGPAIGALSLEVKVRGLEAPSKVEVTEGGGEQVVFHLPPPGGYSGPGWKSDPCPHCGKPIGEAG